MKRRLFTVESGGLSPSISRQYSMQMIPVELKCAVDTSLEKRFRHIKTYETITPARWWWICWMKRIYQHSQLMLRCHSDASRSWKSSSVAQVLGKMCRAGLDNHYPPLIFRKIRMWLQLWFNDRIQKESPPLLPFLISRISKDFHSEYDNNHYACASYYPPTSAQWMEMKTTAHWGCDYRHFLKAHKAARIEWAQRKLWNLNGAPR